MANLKKLINYFHGVKVEIERVKWPTKKEVLKYSISTIGFIIFFALLFYAIDLIVTFIRELM